MLYLSAADVARALEQIDAPVVVSEVLSAHARGDAELAAEAYLSWNAPDGGQARTLNMPGMIRGSRIVVGTKIINGNLANPTRGLPRASGLTMLFDPLSARIVCLMEGAQISARRTACVSLAATRALARTSAETVAVIGVGVIGQEHCEVLCRELAWLRQLVLFDIEPQRLMSLAQVFRRRFSDKNLRIETVATVEEAIREADVIVACTTTASGYIRPEWLRRGALVVNVSLDDVPPDLFRAADKVVVDDWALVAADDRRVLGRLFHAGQAVGPFDPPRDNAVRVEAELGSILVGTTVGRRSDDEIVVVNPFGMAIEDLALAAKVEEVARQQGLGVVLPV